MFKAIGLLFRFLYHFLFINQRTGQLSHTKFWSNVGYAVWVWAFPYAVIHGSQANFELWMVFGAVVIGNQSLQEYMLAKNGIKIDENATWKAVFHGDDEPGSPS